MTRARAAAASRSRGFALLIVLWMLIPLAILFLALTGTARTETRLTFNLRDAARLGAAADAAIETGVFGLLRGDTVPLRLSLDGAVATVRVRSLSGLVNPNIASPDLLRALLLQLGAEPASATRIALAIAEWRSPASPPADAARVAAYRAAGLDYAPPGAPFRSLGELGRVLGMTPALSTAMAPMLTLFTDRPPEYALAPPPVQAALGALGLRGAGPVEGGDVYEIAAEVRGADGARAARDATVRVGATKSGRPWRILAWGDPPPAR